MAKGKREEERLSAQSGEEAKRAIARAIADPGFTTVMDIHMDQAVRMTRSAVYHAFNARPDLRPLDNYGIAVRDARLAAAAQRKARA